MTNTEQRWIGSGLGVAPTRPAWHGSSAASPAGQPVSCLLLAPTSVPFATQPCWPGRRYAASLCDVAFLNGWAPLPASAGAQVVFETHQESQAGGFCIDAKLMDKRNPEPIEVGRGRARNKQFGKQVGGCLHEEMNMILLDGIPSRWPRVWVQEACLHACLFCLPVLCGCMRGGAPRLLRRWEAAGAARRFGRKSIMGVVTGF